MGNIAFAKGQIGVEATAGTSVAATRQLVGKLNLEDARTRDFRDDEQRGSFARGNQATDLAYLSTGKYVARATTMELPYWLSAAIRGDVAPTQPDATNAPTVRLWTFAAPLTSIPTVKTLSAYHGDDQQAMRAAGCAVKKVTIKGGDDKPLMLTLDLIGRRYQAGTFAALTQPTTEDLKSLLTKWYIDPTGAGIGTTQVMGTFYEWEWALETGIVPDYTEDGSLDMSGFGREKPLATLKLKAKWNSSMVSEFSSYDTAARRFIRQEISGSTIATTFAHRLRLDGAYVINKFVTGDGDKNGHTLVSLEAQTTEDATWAKMYELTVQNSLAAL